MEDERIVALYLARDEDALRHTKDKYGERLRRLSYGITADLSIAEECENDAYLQAWSLIPPNEPRTYLYAFLARITRHISIDRCRGKSAVVVELTDELSACLPSPDDVSEEVGAKLLGEEISRFLLTQSWDKRVIFMRRYFFADSVAEIAKRLGFSESKVKTSLFRTRNDLKAHLLKEGYTL